MIRSGSRYPWIFSATALAGLAVVGTILFCFDPSDYGFYPICFFHQTTGLLCPGCGSLRAVHKLLHGNVSAAFRFNPLLILALPLFLWLGAVYALRTIREEQMRLALSAKWVWLMVGIVLAVSVWRNLPGSPFAMLPH